MINDTSIQSVSQGPIHPYIIPLKPITDSAMAYFCSALNCSFGPTAPWLILINGHEQQLNKLQWPEYIQESPIKAGCFSLHYWLLHSIQTSRKVMQVTASKVCCVFTEDSEASGGVVIYQSKPAEQKNTAFWNIGGIEFSCFSLNQSKT